MRNISKRLAIMENSNNVKKMPDAERIIVIPYRDGDEGHFAEMRQKHLSALCAKYGTIKESDLLFIGIRKFCPLD